MKKNSRPIYNNRRTGKPMIGKSRKLQGAEEEAYYQLVEQKGQLMQLPFTGLLHIKFLFFRETQHRVDLSNLYEFAQDALQTAGIIFNDCLIESHDGSRKLYDPLHPRTEIYIAPFEG